MRVLIDIGHPAHVHFFKNPINILQRSGHEIIITSRTKEMTQLLLDQAGVEHFNLSNQGPGGIKSLLSELLVRDCRLYNLVKKVRPDVMAGIGGIFIAHVGAITRIPSIVFYDTENAKLQNILTYPLAKRVVVPDCYRAWTPKWKTLRYKGYHELSYLHPAYFTPDRNIAIINGMVEGQENYLLRLVSWKASHDIGQSGLSIDNIRLLVSYLSKRGNIVISSEAELTDDLKKYQYRGDISQIHHLLAYCDGYIGESATMGSEAVVLGVPSVFISAEGRGYTTEQELRYGLSKNIEKNDWLSIKEGIDWLLTLDIYKWDERHTQMLANTIDVASFVGEQIIATGRPRKLCD
ncbi:putative glycosyltransferase [Methylohalomonas lacus]|uniref:Glycosyltransferase n=1 Tax=Methylohalomonas lacus TaxID=398773 RepID=A0AAE3HK87_9GAMM|nr:DUF354 domain-containing protein [Methylohalomonas lacus]MCS3903885.1 putative glycosyltransferase [Methylohalomonas lacus]